MYINQPQAIGIDDSSTLEAVSPVRPAAPYLGGKRQLAKTIIQRINQIPHQTYAEPFVGMGGVFFRRTMRPRAEIINDFSGDVVNLFRILQRHYGPFLEMLRFQLTTRKDFERLRNIDTSTLTDLERAARFLYLQRVAYGGMIIDRSFAPQPAKPSFFDVTKIVPLLADIHVRLSGVVVECLSYEDFIIRYDRADTLFYLDPPYWGFENRYGKGMFEREDFARLAAILKGIKGKFIMSIGDTPEVRQMFAEFRIVEVAVTYTANNGGNTRAGELLITVGNR